jgi:sulfur-oxidizing protein SoxY
MTTVENLKQTSLGTVSGLLSGMLLFCWSLSAWSEPAMESVGRWQQIKTSLFGDQLIENGDDVIALDSPYRAEDAAVVPISIESRIEQTPQRYLKALYLVIDNNPSPVAAIFHFTGKHNWQTLSTRVRVNSYTDLRAIAKTSDDKLYMVSNYVKASGGCSAPSLKDPAAAMADLGKIKFRLSEAASSDGLLPAQLLIKHPNNSGLQFDQISRRYIPADFVRTIEVTYNGEEVFTVDTDISISEDPNIRFGILPQQEGVLEVRVKDSKGRTFSHSVKLPAQDKG